MGFATEDTEGTEATGVPQVGSVVSVILCGLSESPRAVHPVRSRAACVGWQPL